MKNLFNKFAAAILVGLSVLLTSFVGANPLGYSVATGYQKSLRASMTATQTTVPVTSLTLTDGTVLNSSTFPGRIFLMIDAGKPTRQEIVLCTGIDDVNLNFDPCDRGLAFSGTSTVSVAGNRRTHNAGAIVTMANVHYVYEELVDKDADETISGEKTFPDLVTFGTLPVIPTTTPTSSGQVASKMYVDNVIVAGAPDGTESVKGIWEGATQAEMAAGTITGGTGANLVILSRYATSTRTGTGNYVMVTAGSGYVSSTFGGVAFSMATLNSSALVVQNPASASVTAGTSTIPITSSVTSSLSGSYFGTTTPGSVFYVGSDGFTTSLLNGVFGQVLKTNSTNTSTAMTAPEWAYSGLIFATTTNVSLSGSGTQTVLTTQIPANVLKRGSAIRVKGQISYSNSSGSNKTYSPSVQYGGGSGVCGFGGMLALSLGGSASATFECVIQYVDATNQEGFGFSLGSDGNGVFTSVALGTGTTTPASAQNLSILNNTNTGTGEGSLNSLTIEVY